MVNWRFGFGGLDSWDPLLKAIVTPPRIPNQQPKPTINHLSLIEISQKKQLSDMISCVEGRSSYPKRSGEKPPGDAGPKWKGKGQKQQEQSHLN